MFEFTKDFFVGVNKIDEIRIKYFELLNTMVTSDLAKEPDAKLEMVIEKLTEYAEESFRLEEEYMEEVADKELESQKKEHADFLEKIARYKEGMAGAEGDEAHAKLLEIVRFMIKWLYSHLVSKDTLIQKPVKAKKEESKPADMKKEDENPFAFTSRYVTGIDFVDEEHKKLFEIIAEVNSVLHDEFLYDKYDQITHILGELIDYTKMHFADEEAYMESINYEALPTHRKAHVAFVEKIESIDLAEVDESQDKYLVDLLDFLLKWLVNHILDVDKLIPVK